MENLEIANQGVDPLVGANTTTKEDLLRRAKEAIEDGEQFLHKAADALGLAQQDFSASQREIAKAVGKSVAWVNRLLQWHQGGCRGTPFGPGSKESRERRKRVQATEQQAPLKAVAEDAQTSAERRKAEYEKDEADAPREAEDSAERRKPEDAQDKTVAEEAEDGADRCKPKNAKRDAEPVTATSAKALVEFKYAVDHWFPKMDDSTKRDAVAYAVARVETS